MAKKYFNLIVIIFLVFSSISWSQTDDEDKSQSTSVYGKGALSVTVGGSFITNGTFAASPTERVDQFITRIFNRAKNSALGLSSEKDFIQKTKKEIEKYAERNITLIRYEGETINVDLKKFRLTGNFKYNPYLKNGDVLIFHEYDKENNFISVAGAVNKEGTFQFSPGDSLTDALLFAHGINKAYKNVDSAIISRLSYDGKEEEFIKVSIDKNFPLQRGDRIRVIANEPKRKDYKVLVLGEVNSPGYVYITKNSTTLRDVIERSKWLTDEASLKNAQLIRDSQLRVYSSNYLKKEENKLLQTNRIRETLMMRRLSTLTNEDSLYFDIDNQLRLLDSVGSIDFTKLEYPKSSESNYIVRDGDIIIIPKKREVVYVFGQVPERGYLSYVPGKDYKYYIDKAGGLSEAAEDIDETMIIKSKTRDWINVANEQAVVEPGDYIYVPKDPPKSFNYYLSRISAVSSIIGSIATVILIILQSTK